MKVYTVKFEGYDDINEPVFKVENFDGTCAEVTISTPVNIDLWDEVSAAVRQCLIDMKLGE